MTRRYVLILVVLCLMLGLYGCKTEKPEPEQSYPTLPDFQEELTPLQQLTAAIEKTKNQGSYEIRYGTKIIRDGQNEENARSQNVSSQKPLDRDAIYEYLPDLPQKDDFLQSFCNKKLRVIPSNTGLIRFQLSELSWEEAWQMMYQQEPQGAFAQAVCEITFEVDGAGRLAGFEMSMTTEEETKTVFLSIIFSDEL